MDETPPGTQIDNHIEALDAKVREQDEQIERLTRMYNNLKVEIIEIRGQLTPARKRT